MAGAVRNLSTTALRRQPELFSPSTYTAVEELSNSRIQERLSRSILGEFPVDEQKARIQLAACYRLFGYFGWNDDVINHLTVSVTEPDGSKSFLINPFGLRYDEVTASSLLKIDSHGKLRHPGVVGDIFKVNRAGFVIHSAIHNMGPPSYHNFDGIVVNEKEQPELVRDLGDSNVLLLRNHGVITTGETIGGAWYRMYMLVRSSKLQATAQATAPSGGGLHLATPESVKRTFEIAKTFSGHEFGTMEFSAFMRLMDKVDASYRL
ncbi:hypothetical protein MBRA1_002913 [Malassezia brasiliensis]|uniref:Class II aldolase/adducin N-terminal domain-containing protein n=1 Tax=Malassezia brasiliensis TaxID=1821822 RepID=A0AAF0IPJ6_9BASI|nr:hypothetical protein MBRA1_002913 [Malassezia brasiliensis]